MTKDSTVRWDSESQAKNSMTENRSIRVQSKTESLVVNTPSIFHLLIGTLWRRIVRYRFGLAAFLIPLTIRTIPEIIVGPYPIGWDTIAFYVPNTLDWAAGKVGPLQMLGTAPMMYVISVSAYLLLGVNPVWIFKVMGPVLYGCMMYALYRFLKLSLKWPEERAVGGALLTSLYFVTLRIGWDMYRNMLGLTFILLSLPLLEDFKGSKNQATLALLIVLAVASDQLTGVIILALAGARVLTVMTRKEWTEFKRLIMTVLPGGAFFLSILYVDQTAPGSSILQSRASIPSLGSLGSSIGFLGYAYLALIPLIILGARRVRSLDLRNWSVLCIGLVLIALLPFLGLIVASYRWSLLIDIPMCVYATAGLSRLTGSTRATINGITTVQTWILPTSFTVLAISTMLYVATPAQNAMPYYAAFPALLPTSMIQDSVPLSDMGSLHQLLDSMATKLSPGTALIAHQAIYGWARAYLSNQENIINYGYSSPLHGVSMARAGGYSTIWTIWWIPGLGWHGQPYLPAGFIMESRYGNLAVYRYQ